MYHWLGYQIEAVSMLNSIFSLICMQDMENDFFSFSLFLSSSCSAEIILLSSSSWGIRACEA